MIRGALVLFGLFFVQEPDIDSLVRQLSEESVETRDRAAASLVNLGERAVEKLKAAAARGDEAVKARIGSILTTIEKNRLLATLLPPLQRLTFEAKDRPFADAIADFKAKTGLAVAIDGRLPNVPRITDSVREATPMQALDAICDAAGYSYGVDSFGRSGAQALRLVHRPFKDLSRSYVRHYVVRVVNATLDTSASPNLALDLELHFPSTLRPAGLKRAQVTSVVDDQARSIYTLKGDPFAPPHGDEGKGRPMADVDCGSHTFRLALHAAETGIEKLASVKGEIDVRFCLDRKIVGFDSPADQIGKAIVHEGAEVKLAGYSLAGDVATFDLEMTRCAFGFGNPALRGLDYMSVSVKTEDGSTPRRGKLEGRRKSDTGYTARMEFTGVKSKVTRIEFEMDATYHSDLVEFELKDIKLSKRGRR